MEAMEKMQFEILAKLSILAGSSMTASTPASSSQPCFRVACTLRFGTYEWSFAIYQEKETGNDSFSDERQAIELLEVTTPLSDYLRSSDRSCSLHLVASIPKELEFDEKFITHKVSFSEINKAFDYMLKGQSIRCIIRTED
ncbi:Alcohol dehydrogenase superfamily, zinc-type [Parasponia andersonii]|uniref:Alcohol dehydrogenase superfamily, zinc-type n=1 Tax=Parasponia andersonii TaxID=3476 RepID=A0A2P5DMF7_PARAD|nr:Alcohol dehydrogenase superfamily, zinc-type [Parasponia andersonii]